jgi:hypothetical protein
VINELTNQIKGKNMNNPNKQNQKNLIVSYKAWCNVWREHPSHFFFMVCAVSLLAISWLVEVIK